MEWNNIGNPTNSAGLHHAQVNDTWWGSRGNEWNGTDISFLFQWAITRADKTLDASVERQTIFTGVRECKRPRISGTLSPIRTPQKPLLPTPSLRQCPQHQRQQRQRRLQPPHHGRRHQQPLLLPPPRRFRKAAASDRQRLASRARVPTHQERRQALPVGLVAATCSPPQARRSHTGRSRLLSCSGSLRCWPVASSPSSSCGAYGNAAAARTSRTAGRWAHRRP